jgi:hypothetical protein
MSRSSWFRLRNKPADPPKICQAQVSKSYLRTYPLHSGQCKRQARFVIYGKALCTEHAALKALRILTFRGEIDSA